MKSELPHVSGDGIENFFVSARKREFAQFGKLQPPARLTGGNARRWFLHGEGFERDSIPRDRMLDGADRFELVRTKAQDAVRGVAEIDRSAVEFHVGKFPE